MELPVSKKCMSVHSEKHRGHLAKGCGLSNEFMLGLSVGFENSGLFILDSGRFQMTFGQPHSGFRPRKTFDEAPFCFEGFHPLSTILKKLIAEVLFDILDRSVDGQKQRQLTTGLPSQRPSATHRSGTDRAEPDRIHRLGDETFVTSP